MVGHAARVQASAGPATSVVPEVEYAPPQTLQSARADNRPSAKFTVYAAPSGRSWRGWPAGWTEVSVHVPSSCAATNTGDEADDEADGEVGEPEHALARAERTKIRINETEQLRIRLTEQGICRCRV